MKFIVNRAVDVDRAVCRVPGLRCCGVVGVDMDMGIYLGIWIKTKMKSEEGACSRYNIQSLGAGAFREHAEEKRLESSHTII